MKKIGRNEPCPCGSGKKYKNCCSEKNDKDIQEQEKSDKTPIFPNISSISEEDYKEKVSEMLKMINVAPQIIYAFNKLGYCIMDGQQDKYTNEELKDWKSAIKEYFQTHE